MWITPIVGAILTPVFARIHHKLRDYMAVLFSLAAAVLASSLIPQILTGAPAELNQVPWIPILNVKAGVLADPLSVIISNVVAWISFLIMVYSLGYMHGDKSLTRYWFWMNFFIGNMLLLVLSDNLLQMFFGWEGVGLCSYALIGFYYKDEKKYWVGQPGHHVWNIPMEYSPSHAGMKAFVTTRIGDISLLAAIFIIYAYSHTFNFQELMQHSGWAAELAKAGLLVPAALLFFGGPVGKSAQFPLHEWLPDAMAGPTSVSALIHAATMVKAGVYLMARMGIIFFIVGVSSSFFGVVAWIGALTAILAASQALVAVEIKKVMAYSTVSQIGYMMLALGAGGLSHDFTVGTTAGIFHLMSHAVFKAALFLSAGAIIHATETRFMNEMGGLRKYMKYTFIAMLIASLSLSGIPPLGGFWSKDAVLLVTLESGQTVLFVLAAITAMMTFLYTLRMLGMVFLGKESHFIETLHAKGHHIHEAPKVMWVPYMLLAVGTVVLGAVAPLGLESYMHGLLGAGAPIHLEATLIQVGEALIDPRLVAVATSLVMLLVGGVLGYYFYVGRKADPTQFVQRSAFLERFQVFLCNRWYINPSYYKLFVNAPIAIAHGMWRSLETGFFDKVNYVVAPFILGAATRLYKGFEMGVMDRFNYRLAGGGVKFSTLSDRIDIGVVDRTVNAVASLGSRFSNTIRRIQTGVTQQYVFIFLVGVMFLILMVIFSLGG